VAFVAGAATAHQASLRAAEEELIAWRLIDEWTAWGRNRRRRQTPVGPL